METNGVRDRLISVTKDDLTIQTFRSGGKGGQHQNKVSSGVRIIHRDSGAVAESRSDRSQYRNKQIAFKKLTESKVFKDWLRLECAKKVGVYDEIEKSVERALRSRNVKVESYDSKLHKWVTYDKNCE